jgi:hypothetical protein
MNYSTNALTWAEPALGMLILTETAIFVLWMMVVVAIALLSTLFYKKTERVILLGLILVSLLTAYRMYDAFIPKTYLNEKVKATQKNVTTTRYGGMVAIYQLDNGGLVEVPVKQGDVTHLDHIYKQQ